jgi:hypothetical protein
MMGLAAAIKLQPSSEVDVTHLAGLFALSALFLTTLAALSTTGLTATLLLSTALFLTTFVLVVWHLS